MRRTLSFLACIAFLLTGGLTVQSQESKADRELGSPVKGDPVAVPTGCSKLLVMAGDWNNPEIRTPNRFTSGQIKWWIEEGHKKFKNVCLVARIEEADYVLAWAEQWRDYNQQIVLPKTNTTQHSGTVNTTSTNGTSTLGTYRGTSSTTTYENQSYEYTIQRVTAYLYKTEGTDGNRQVMGMPIFTSNHKGYWRRSKPDKDVLVDALKYLAKHKM